MTRMVTQHFADRVNTSFATLQHGSVRLYCQTAQEAGDDLDLLMQSLNQCERDQIVKFRFRRDQMHYAAARSFLRRVMGAETGRTPSDLAISYEPKGKPVLPNAPQFNLTHSCGVAVLAVSDIGPVGVDLELADRMIDTLSLAKVCLTKAEQDMLACLEPDEQRVRFLIWWMAKEARMKLTGEGLHLPPQRVELMLCDGWPTGFLAPSSPAARLDLVGLPGDGPTCAVATLVREESVQRTASSLAAQNGVADA